MRRSSLSEPLLLKDLRKRQNHYVMVGGLKHFSLPHLFFLRLFLPSPILCGGTRALAHRGAFPGCTPVVALLFVAVTICFGVCLMSYIFTGLHYSRISFSGCRPVVIVYEVKNRRVAVFQAANSAPCQRPTMAITQ